MQHDNQRQSPAYGALGVYSLYESVPSKALNCPLMNVPGAGLAGETPLASTRFSSASLLVRVDLGGLSSVRTRAADRAALLFAAREALKSDLNGFFTREASWALRPAHDR